MQGRPAAADRNAADAQPRRKHEEDDDRDGGGGALGRRMLLRVRPRRVRREGGLARRQERDPALDEPARLRGRARRRGGGGEDRDRHEGGRRVPEAGRGVQGDGAQGGGHGRDARLQEGAHRPRRERGRRRLRRLGRAPRGAQRRRGLPLRDEEAGHDHGRRRKGRADDPLRGGGVRAQLRQRRRLRGDGAGGVQGGRGRDGQGEGAQLRLPAVRLQGGGRERGGDRVGRLRLPDPQPREAGGRGRVRLDVRGLPEAHLPRGRLGQPQADREGRALGRRRRA